MKINANCGATSAAGSWNEPMPGSVNSAACWCVMSICSPPTVPSSTWLASGSRSGGIFETRSSNSESKVHLSARVMQGCHAIRRAFVPVFRAALGFLRASAAGFLVLVAAGFLALDTAGFLALATAGFLDLAKEGFLALVTAAFLALAKAGFLVLAAPGFLVLATVVLLALATASTGAANSVWGGFGVRWWPWCSGWMRAASSSVRS